MSKQSRVTNDIDRQKIIEMHHDGFDLTEISIATNFSKPAIKRELQKVGLLDVSNYAEKQFKNAAYLYLKKQVANDKLSLLALDVLGVK